MIISLEDLLFKVGRLLEIEDKVSLILLIKKVKQDILQNQKQENMSNDKDSCRLQEVNWYTKTSSMLKIAFKNSS